MKHISRKVKKAQETVEFICTFCGAKENIPKAVVDQMDATDNKGDMSYPPRFTCSVCPDGLMHPIKYTSTRGKTYKTDPKSIKPVDIVSF